MSRIDDAEEIWVGPPGHRPLAFRMRRPAGQGRALVVIVHGFGEHGGRYRPLAEALAGEGFVVAIPDLWGHGRSGGSRGDLGQVEESVRDLQSITEAVFLPRSGLPAPFAVFGHSFGGLLAIVWALSAPQAIRRLVAQSPFLDVGSPIPRWKRASAAWLARWRPTFAFPMDLDAGALSHDPAVVQAYRSDPLVHNRMSVQTYRSILQAQGHAVRRAETLRVPLLLLCGASDRIISVEAARRWFDRVRCEKASVVFPECYHELHHEAVRGEVVRRAAEWLR